jgi:cytochrome c-type biogenesis protein CcmH
MSAFFLVAAGLVAAALAFVLRPLLGRANKKKISRTEANVAIYRDELRELDADLAAGTLARADYERARVELEARLLEDVSAADASSAAPARRTGAWAVGIAVPLMAAAVYLLTGDPGAMLATRRVPDAAQVEAMVARLAAKMREHPEDAEGWKLLGRSYTVMGRFPEAVDAYAKAAERSPRDAQLLADFADVLAMAHGQTLQGEPEKLVQRALEIDPKNLKALALLGTAAYERKDYASAAQIWSRMLPLVPPGSEDAQAITQNVEEARKLAGIGEPQGPGGKKQPVAASGVRGVVQLAAQLAGQAKPEDTVYVFARAAEGPPMPLAVMRGRVADLPLRFTLDDSMAMAPNFALSNFPSVVVGARISKSGNATPQSGDLAADERLVDVGDAGVALTIDKQIP